jgi:hypothetical protein
MRRLFKEMPIEVSRLDLRSGILCNNELCSSLHRVIKISGVSKPSARFAISTIASGTQSIAVNNLEHIYPQIMSQKRDTHGSIQGSSSKQSESARNALRADATSNGPS